MDPRDPDAGAAETDRVQSTEASDRPPARTSVAVLAGRAADRDLLAALAREEGFDVADAAAAGGGRTLPAALRDWRENPSVSVVVGWLRGATLDRAFVDAAQSLVAETPVVALAADERADQPAAAAGATPAAVRAAALRQAGVLRAESVEALFDAATVLGGQPVPPGDGIAVVSNAGGPGVMAADAVAETPLSLARFDDETVAALDAALPDGATLHNPVDTLADAGLTAFRQSLDAVLADEGVAGAVVISAPSKLFAFEELAAIVADARREHDKPVAGALMGGEATADAAAVLAGAGVPNFFDPGRAVRALATLRRYREARAEAREAVAPEPVDVDWPAVERALADDDALGVLSAAGVETRAGGVDAADAVTATLGATADPPAVGLRLSGELGAAFDDVAVRVPPVAWPEAARLVADLRGAPVLRGVRGRAMLDLEALVGTVQRVGALAGDGPVAAIEVDPLVVAPDGVYAVDARVETSEE